MPVLRRRITTTTQTLADGTRIERTVRARFYRDGEGRTRREQTILGHRDRSASRRRSRSSIRWRGHVRPESGHARGRRSPLPTPSRRARVSPPPPPPPPGGELQHLPRLPAAATYRRPPAWQPAVAPGASAGKRGPGERIPNVPESLGTKQMDGLMVTGTKRTEVIPTGRIGNDRPIEDHR